MLLNREITTHSRKQTIQTLLESSYYNHQNKIMDKFNYPIYSSLGSWDESKYPVK